MAVHISDDQNSKGIVSYNIDKLSDKDKLPQKGLTTGSTAVLCENGELSVFYFTQGDIIDGIEQNGRWDII